MNKPMHQTVPAGPNLCALAIHGADGKDAAEMSSESGRGTAREKLPTASSHLNES